MFSENKGSIENLRVDVDAYIRAYSGIICSINTGKIADIELSGTIEYTSSSAGGNWLGGICYNNKGEIVKVCNYAEIKGYNSTSTGNYIGGICSQNHGIVQQCKNEGKIWNANNAKGELWA